MSGSIHHQANLVLRFVLELCALAALFYWGWWAGEGTFAGLALGLGAVLLAAVFWGLFAAPRARVPVPLSGRLAVELAFFGSAATGLYATGHSAPAVLLFGLAVCNRALIQAWRQDERIRTDAGPPAGLHAAEAARVAPIMARRVLPAKPPELAPHECPVELTALVLCRAAAPHIIRDLAPGPRTFTELRTTIVEAGASSSRTLAARLKSLEGEGYVTRTALKGYHRRVEYDLSEKGRDLVPVVEAMKGFGESWLLDDDCEKLPDLRPPKS